MTFNSYIKQMVCNSCGLSLTRHELDMYWKKIREENRQDDDDLTQKKSRRKEWLEWYSKSKEDKRAL